MEGRGILSPQRSRYSLTTPKKATPDRKPDRKLGNRNVDNNGSKQKLVTPKLKPSPNPNHNKTKPTTPSPKTKIAKPYSHPVANQNHPYLRAASDSAILHPPDISDHLLQRLSFDGKDLAEILQGNSLYDLISPNKKEESSSQSNDDSRLFQIYKEIASHRQENLSVEAYFTKLEALWVELVYYTADLAQRSSNNAIENLSELTEREKVVQFLVGLNDSYATICTQILLINPFPTVEKAYAEISREEKRRELVVALEAVAAKVIQTNWLLRNQNGRSNNNGDNNYGSDQEVDNSNLQSPN